MSFELVRTAQTECVPNFNANTQNSIIVSFLVFFLSGLCGSFVIDRSAHVSLHHHHLFTIIYINKALIETASSAIWNRNRVAVAAAIGVWLINVGFLIQGRSRLLPLLQSILNH